MSGVSSTRKQTSFRRLQTTAPATRHENVCSPIESRIADNPRLQTPSWYFLDQHLLQWHSPHRWESRPPWSIAAVRFVCRVVGGCVHGRRVRSEPRDECTTRKPSMILYRVPGHGYLARTVLHGLTMAYPCNYSMPR